MHLKDDSNAEMKGIIDDGVRYDSLRFTCPKDGCTIMVRIVRDRPAYRIDEDTFVWNASGEFPNVTLDPSVDVKEYKGGPSHWHGHVTNGDVK